MKLNKRNRTNEIEWNGTKWNEIEQNLTKSNKIEQNRTIKIDQTKLNRRNRTSEIQQTKSNEIDRTKSIERNRTNEIERTMAVTCQLRFNTRCGGGSDFWVVCSLHAGTTVTATTRTRRRRRGTPRRWDGRERLIIIIIIAKMAVFNVAGYLVEERRGWPVITDTIFRINSEFWKKGTFGWENRTGCPVGLKTHPTIVPWTRGPKVSHASTRRWWRWFHERNCSNTSSDVLPRVRTDTDAGIGTGDTGISLPTPIPIRGIADMTILKRDNYHAFATAEAVLSLHI